MNALLWKNNPEKKKKKTENILPKLSTVGYYANCDIPLLSALLLILCVSVEDPDCQMFVHVCNVHICLEGTFVCLSYQQSAPSYSTEQLHKGTVYQDFMTVLKNKAGTASPCPEDRGWVISITFWGTLGTYSAIASRSCCLRHRAIKYGTFAQCDSVDATCVFVHFYVPGVDLY